MKIRKIKVDWRRLSSSSGFHNALMFIIFVAVAIIFWFILALNDSVTETFRVSLRVINVPDSITFINDPPASFHVTLRDKGTNILRSGVVKNPTMELNFREFAHDGIFHLTQADLIAELKSDIGSGASIASVSLDSLRLYYTSDPGRRVPVEVVSDLSSAAGYIIVGRPVPLTKSVKIFSFRDEIDTIRRVRTQRLARRDLQQTSTFAVKFMPIPNVKIVPSQIDVRVNVEPLVHKEIYVPVETDGVPPGESLLLFPNRVPVSLYVPMSRFNEDVFPITITADYEDVRRNRTRRIAVHLRSHADFLINVELRTDSVEYTLVKH